MNKSRHLFLVRGHYPLGRCFPAASAIQTIDNSSRTSTMSTSYNPPIRRQRFGLFPFPPGTEMFHFPGFASRRRYPTDSSSNWRVSPFGYLRITGYKPPPRSFSQVSHVLLRRPRPRHPPCTLMSLARKPEYH